MMILQHNLGSLSIKCQISLLLSKDPTSFKFACFNFCSFKKIKVIAFVCKSIDHLFFET